MKNKIYTSAPLPFQGQKRNHYKHFVEVLKEFDDDATYIDAFGGSGLLSQIIKQNKPNARVIYNDFDDFLERVRHIDDTNELISKIRPLLMKFRKKEKITTEVKEEILSIIDKFKGYKDYITLSSNLSFSGKYAFNFEKLSKQTFCRRDRSFVKSYDATSYLDGVEVVKMDGIELMKKFYNTKAVFVLDPPYLQTLMSGYKGIFSLKQFLEMSKLIREPYVLFSSKKSEVLEFMEWCDKSELKDYKIKVASLSSFGKRDLDYMIYKVGFND